MNRIWSKASDRTQGNRFGFFPSLHVGLSVPYQASPSDCIYVAELGTVNYHSDRYKRPWMAS